MAETTHFGIGKPDDNTTVADEIARLILSWDQADGIFKMLADAIATKAAVNHTHSMSTITGLTDALAAKMAASKTFALGDLTNVSGASEAAVGYVLARTALGFGFQSAAALLGAHQHGVGDVIGLSDAIDAKVAALVAAAPETLDTLAELAGALGNDPNFATTIAAQLGALAAVSTDLATRVTATENADAALGDRVDALETGRWVALAAIATTSGTAVDVPGIPATAMEIDILFDGVSCDGPSLPILRLGTAGGIVSSGYVSATEVGGYSVSATTGFVVYLNTPAQALYGGVTLRKVIGSLWIAQHNASWYPDGRGVTGNGRINLGGTLDRLQLTSDGAQNFDAGQIMVRYR